MRLALILASGAASALVCASPAGALSPDTSCENAKLRAAGAYARCLAHVAKDANAMGGELSDAALARCAARFDRAFERAEANGACRTAGGPATLRGPILGQMEDSFATITTGSGCPSTPVFDQDSSTYACTLKSGSAIDVAAIVTQIGSADVTDDTVVWIEAWGASGGSGNTSNGGSGGSGGYAQMTTTVNDLLEFFGTSEIYYYLGVKGAGPSANAGGDGGTGTIVTINDLTAEEASFDDTALVAGGGGGGGAGRGTSTACGNTADLDLLGGGGGNGGAAISTLDTDSFVAGAKGGARRNHNYSGSGGGGDATGSGGAVNPSGSPARGDAGIAVIGGGGGGRSDPTTGFSNQSGVKISLSGGRGGAPGDDAGGGGGGGGYGGGGGGSEGDGSTDCVSGGGGGGGSLAKASTQSCSRSRPANPNGDRGAVQIIFDAGSCG